MREAKENDHVLDMSEYPHARSMDELVGEAIDKQRRRLRAAHEHMRVALECNASDATCRALKKIIDRECEYGD